MDGVLRTNRPILVCPLVTMRTILVCPLVTNDDLLVTRLPQSFGDKGYYQPHFEI
jgi:hypothetical protein